MVTQKFNINFNGSMCMNIIKVPEEELRSPKVMTQTQLQQQQKESGTMGVNSSLKDLILNELNPDVDEFVPVKFSEGGDEEAASSSPSSSSS